MLINDSGSPLEQVETASSIQVSTRSVSVPDETCHPSLPDEVCSRESARTACAENTVHARPCDEINLIDDGHLAFRDRVRRGKDWQSGVLALPRTTVALGASSQRFRRFMDSRHP